MNPPFPRRVRQLHGVTLALLALQLRPAIGPGAGSPMLTAAVAVLLAASTLRLFTAADAMELRPITLAELLSLGLLALQPPALTQATLQGISGGMLLAALIQQEAGGAGSLLQMLRRSLHQAIGLLPLLALLLVLPRWGGQGLQLWPRDNAATALSGLSDVLDPGSLSALQRSMAPALRIRWRRGSPPPPTERYWRVLVLDRFDGRRWSAGPTAAMAPRAAASPPSAPAGLPDQLWLAEPMPGAALPWPGVGQASPSTLTINRQGVLLARSTADVPQRYGITPERGEAPWQRQPPQPQEWMVPAGRNPRLEQLGASWRRRAPLARIAAATQLFRDQGLRYSTTPAPLPPLAPLDALVFQTREGFCEHLASAFTLLMRAAGLPARVVLGYQGGQWVPPSPWGPGYLDVRQSDAHAWSEVWLEGRGWQRLDPTAWLAPERLSAEHRWRREGPPWQGLERLWQHLRLAHSDGPSVNTVFDNPGGLLLLAPALALAAGVGLLRRLQPDGTRQRQRLERCLAPLRGWGLEPQPGESLVAFCDRAGRTRPELRQALLTLAASYNRLRFAADDPMAARRQWRRAQQDLARRLRRRRPGALQRAHPSPSAPAP